MQRFGVPLRMCRLSAILIFGSMRDRVKFCIKQLFYHGKNLGQFVGIYKLVCCLLRNIGISGGIDSWIAGAIGGWYSFGESRGVSGAVNQQIVLYLFARGLEGLVLSAVNRKYLPPVLDIRKPTGFRLLAAFSLACILYLTEYEPETLRPSFMTVMTNLYHESNAGALMPSLNFLPIVAVVVLTMVGEYISPKFGLDNVLKLVLRK